MVCKGSLLYTAGATMNLIRYEVWLDGERGTNLFIHEVTQSDAVRAYSLKLDLVKTFGDSKPEHKTVCVKEVEKKKTLKYDVKIDYKPTYVVTKVGK